MGRAGFAMSAHLMIILRTIARFSGDWKLVKADDTDSGVPRPFCSVEKKNAHSVRRKIDSWKSSTSCQVAKKTESTNCLGTPYMEIN